MTFDQPVTLGSSGLKVGRLGVASSYGAPAAAYEQAFERGCNYFVWGSFIKGRKPAMRDAIRSITAAGRRDDLVLSMHTYAHSAWLTEVYLHKGLKAAGVEYADVLLLGYYSRRPPRRVIDGALRLKEKGLVRHIGLTGHNRKVFPTLVGDGVHDVFHVRYNAVHRGAETEIFALLPEQGCPGIVNFTATAWGKLLAGKRMPDGETPPTAADCYRFVLSQEKVDVTLTGPKDLEQMQQNLSVLDSGPMDEQEMARMRRIGDHIYGRK